MQTTQYDTCDALLRPVLGQRRTERLLGVLELPPIPRPAPGSPARLVADPGASGGPFALRVDLALALGALLFDDVLGRVPHARAYVADLARQGSRMLLDHGALRTVAAPSGALPSGRAAFERLLGPLGYRPLERYPLERLGMTGYAYTHIDLPESVPQYFVSELHPERFSAAFQAVVARVLATSRDPLSDDARGVLFELAGRGALPLERAAGLLPELAACFDRQHELPRLHDYEALLDESAEMAWIATEGQAFNHATDRVADVAAVACEQARLGRPIKDALEVSRSGRVIQTAFRASAVERLFVDDSGELVVRAVPGSFHEFIQRERLADGRLDLAFDAGNAQGIFAMTRAAGSALGERVGAIGAPL